MNHIYKVVWNKARECYMVVSEYAKAQTKSCSISKLFASKAAAKLALGAVVVGLGMGVVGTADAAKLPIYAGEGDSKVQIGYYDDVAKSIFYQTVGVAYISDSHSGQAGLLYNHDNNSNCSIEGSGTQGTALIMRSQGSHIYDGSYNYIIGGQQSDISKTKASGYTTMIGVSDSHVNAQYWALVENSVYGQVTLNAYKDGEKPITSSGHSSLINTADSKINNIHDTIIGSSYAETNGMGATIIGGFSRYLYGTMRNTEANTDKIDFPIKANGDYSTIIGVNANAKDSFVIANGNYSTILGVEATEGKTVEAGAYSAIIGGKDSSAKGSNSVVLAGNNSHADVSDALAFGATTSVTEAGGVALGSNAIANTGAGEIGYDVSEEDGVYKGTGAAWTSTAAAISVGGGKVIDAQGKEVVAIRQITNVAAGTQETDAVNVAQLKQAMENVSVSDNTLTSLGIETNTDKKNGTVNFNTKDINDKDADEETVGSINFTANGGKYNEDTEKYEDTYVRVETVATDEEGNVITDNDGQPVKAYFDLATGSVVKAKKVKADGTLDEVGTDGLFDALTINGQEFKIRDRVTVVAAKDEEGNPTTDPTGTGAKEYTGVTKVEAKPNEMHGWSIQDLNYDGKTFADTTLDQDNTKVTDVAAATGDAIGSMTLDVWDTAGNGVKVKDIAKASEVNTAIKKINTNITNIQGDIIDIKGDITDINTNITNIQGDITEIKGDITNINTKIETVEGKVLTEISSATTGESGVKTQKTTNTFKDGNGNTIGTTISTNTTLFADPEVKGVDIDGTYGSDFTIKDTDENEVVLKDIVTGDTLKKIIESGEIGEKDTDTSIDTFTASELSADGKVTLTIQEKTLDKGVTPEAHTVTISGIASKDDITNLQQNIDNVDNRVTEVKETIGDTNNIHKDIKGDTIVDTINNIDTKVNNTTEVINNINNNINKMDSRISKVGAGAAALAALHPMEFDPDDKLSFAVGAGHYKGKNATALGAFYRPDEKVMFSVGGTIGNGEDMVNVGASFSLDRTPRRTNTKTAMAKEIVELRERLAQMEQFMMQKQNYAPAAGEMKLFPDVPENHWAYEYVKGLQAQGIVEGYPDGGFAGDRMMTRYEFAAMLYKAMQKGANLDSKILGEFENELCRVRVDRISGADNDYRKVERVRVNTGAGKDKYGNKIVAVAKK